MTDLYYPLHSLREGHWFKLICGASFQHLPAVRNLTLAYTLAGADCIDVAADPSVITAAQDGLQTAAKLGQEAQRRGFGFTGSPWLMVSLNDGEDPHFRKAEFNPNECPAECPRPCETICPAGAIAFPDPSEGIYGVSDQRCYGCGRCVPICPSQLIYTRSYVSAPEAIAPLVLQRGVDALEIHTQVGRVEDFKRLWMAIAPWVNRLKLLAISCPDGEGLIDYLWALYQVITPLPCPLVWQTDGRPMSGDIGAGTTRAAVKLGQKVLAAKLPGYVQLAGGTNNQTVAKLKGSGLLNTQVRESLDPGAKEPRGKGAQGQRGPGAEENWDLFSPHLPISRAPHLKNSPSPGQSPCGCPYPCFENSPAPRLPGSPAPFVAGVAYGSYARLLMSPVLDQLEQVNREQAYARASVNTDRPTTGRLEDAPTLLWQAVELAHCLVSQLKSSVNPKQQPLPK